MGTPFLNKSNYSNKYLTFGMGIQDKTWAFDLAFVKRLGSDEYVPYTLQGMESPLVKSDFQATQIVVTLSTKF